MSVLKDLESALKRIIPTSSLPMNYPSHAVMADELVLELADTVVLMSKREHDSHVRRMRQVQRHERAIIKEVKQPSGCTAYSIVDKWRCCLDSGHSGTHRAGGGYEFSADGSKVDIDGNIR